MDKKSKQKYNSYMRKYMLKRYHNRRAEAIQFLGGKCSVCGSTECLEIDHVNPNKKSFGTSKMWSVSNKRFKAELLKCQLLCKRCHLLKTRCDGSTTKNRARGSSIGLSKLTEANVIKVRNMYSSENITHLELALIFGVSRSCISQVIRRTTWQHVK